MLGKNNWLAQIHAWIYPTRCILCGGAGARGLDLCEGCRHDLPANEFACVMCALPLPQNIGGVTLCGRCQVHPRPFTCAHASFLYAPPLDHLILGFKFNDKLAIGRVLGTLLGLELRRTLKERPECIIPVPLHPSRLRERGFNQALELAHQVAKILNIPIDSRSCRRVRATAFQSTLPVKQRRTNIRGAFRVSAPIRARHVAIIDDVITTGETVAEVARVLRRAGVETVEVWSCARTPD
jgi:Predicted amidophosphoribosyltransferases